MPALPHLQDVEPRRFVVKIGSSVVLTENGALNTPALEHLCDGLRALMARGVVALVCSGAIGHGSALIDRYKSYDSDVLSRQLKSRRGRHAASAIGQGALYAELSRMLAARETNTAQVLFTLGEVAEQHQFLNVRMALETLVEWNVLPIINENDTTALDDTTFENNDYLAAQVASMLEATDLIFLTTVDGLYSDDPAITPTAELIPTVARPELALRDFRVRMAGTGHGTGGMYSKVVAAQMAGIGGTQTTICNGLTGNLLRFAQDEQIGTRFSAPKEGMHDKRLGRRLWITARPTRGVVVIDSGAARALTEQKRSLLPVGIVEVHGDFEVGDVVLIKTAERSSGDARGRHTVLGKGMMRYSSDVLRQIQGHKSGEVQRVLDLDAAGVHEAVHRDALVLFSVDDGNSLASEATAGGGQLS